MSQEFKFPHDRPTEHRYPPDAIFTEIGLPDWLTFSRIVILTVLAIAAIDFSLTGFPNTQVPYNYPFFVGIFYVISVVFVLKRMHGIFDEVKLELIDIATRASATNDVLNEEDTVTPREIQTGMEWVIDRAFHPAVIVGGAIIGGGFAVGVMFLLDVFSAFPYLLMDFAYGAGHGLFYGPIIGAVYLVYKISNEYIIDIDILDPDGVGGYQQIGDAIISLVTYGIFLVTLDFIILSSVSFIGKPMFQVAVFGLYVAMVLFLLGLTVFGVFSIRKRLLAIREAKTTNLREQFNDVERRFWEKQQSGEDPQPESDQIRTMQTLFDQLHGMDLWPINLVSFGRLAFSVGSSAAIAAYKAGMIPLPF